MQSFRSGYLGTAGGIAVSMLWAPIAFAQAAPADTALEISSQAYGEIIVTAQKRSETLQQVPVSIAAFGDEALKAQGATDIQSVSLLVPGMQISSGEGKVIIAIRGISTNSVIGVTEGSVASNVDGFYVSRPSALIGSLMDVERVEVLKGPQGTLYGRNATAGTINVITKKPSDQLELEASVEGLMIDDNGTGNGYGIKGSVVANLPLSEAVRTRFSFMKVNRDGYLTGIYPGNVKKDLQNADEFYARAQIEMDLGDDVTWLLGSDNYWADDRGAFILITGQSRPDVQIAGVPEFEFIPKSRKIFIDKPVGNKPRTHAFTSTLEWRASDLVTLRSLTQYRYNRYYNFGEFDSTQAPISEYVYRSPTKLFTQEFQANLEAGRLHGVAGVYYYKEKIKIHQFFDIFGTLPGATLNLDGTAKTQAFAVFGDLTYSVTDALDVTLGGRFTHEKRDGTQNADFSLGVPLATNIADLPAVSFNAFTPKLVINYKPTNDLTFYASAQRGFKGGGFNIGSLSDNRPYEPEKIDAFEVGAKLRLFDRRLIINAAAFYYDYKNLQVEVIESTESLIRNAAKARIKGFEVDGQIRPVDNLRLDFSASVLDAKAISDDPIINPLFGVPESIKGNRLPRSSKFSASAGAAYDFVLASDARITPSFTASYRSHQYLTIFNNDLVAQDGFWWLRASLTYKSPGNKWSVALFGDNLTNEYVLNSANPAAPGYGYGRQSSVAPPRTFGIRFDWAL